jgi:antitoxin component YwqK of YwqJK toxin-antitoxin module
MKDSKQISYYRNGKINQKLKRKPLFFIDRFKSNDKKRTLNYIWTIYDTTGTKVKEVNFYSESTLRLYSTFFYNSAKNFSNVSYFENGKMRVSFFSEYYNDENVSIPVKYSMLMYENGKFKYMKDLLPSVYNEIITEYEIKYKQLTKPKLH